MITSPLRQAVFTSVIAAERIQPKSLLAQSVLASLALTVIVAYRHSLSFVIGRNCLFRPTCSQCAQSAIRTHGWNKGIVIAARQLRDCGGGYSLRMTSGGVEMVTESGRVVPETALAPSITEKLRAPPMMPR